MWFFGRDVRLMRVNHGRHWPTSRCQLSCPQRLLVWNTQLNLLSFPARNAGILHLEIGGFAPKLRPHFCWGRKKMTAYKECTCYSAARKIPDAHTSAVS